MTASEGKQVGDDEREERLVGRFYANTFEVGHNALEFKVDCGLENVVDAQSASGEDMTIYFRIISSPLNARQLFRLLGVGLLRYADRFGRIDDPSDGGPSTTGLVAGGADEA